MSQITLKGQAIQTSGTLPQVGSQAPEFTLVDTNLEEVSLSKLTGKKILNIFPSVDTSVCATSVRRFNEEADRQGVYILNISADLPFAHQRFCGAEGIEKARSLSTFRSDFAQRYGLEITEGALAGLCSRAVLVLDEDNKVVYAEQVPEIVQEPEYAKALAAL